MPPKARIEEESFQRALQSLAGDEIALLDTSKSTADVWTRLCILMDKADNMENRRACYDVWKRKRAKWQDSMKSQPKVCLPVLSINVSHW